MTRALVRTQIRLQQMATKRTEAGQGTLEYIGMIAIAGLFAIGLVAAAKEVGLSAKFGVAINNIFGTNT